MSANKAKPAKQLPQAVQAARILLRPQNRAPVLAALLGVVAIVGLVLAWNRWGAPATKTAEYRVAPDQIAVTPPPTWIHADVKADVVRTTGLDDLDLRDPDLVSKVAQAFALHAWVAKVVRVEKHFPAHVEVTLDYRRPVAAVEIASGGKAGLLFIDADSVLLPSSDFAQNQAKDYLRISAGQTTPASVYGAPWGDERIAGAARVAAAWGERFLTAGLHRIVPAQTGDETTYELRTAGDTRVLWGHAPGHESIGEPTAEQKIQRLLDHVADKGPLDREGGERVVDLQDFEGSHSRAQ